MDAARRGADGPANRATHEQYVDELRSLMERPIVDDANLEHLIDEMWRPGAQIGNGSTAAAARFELANPGARIGGRQHIEKAENAVRSLERWLRNNPIASISDRAAAENILMDLRNALEAH